MLLKHTVWGECVKSKKNFPQRNEQLQGKRPPDHLEFQLSEEPWHLRMCNCEQLIRIWIVRAATDEGEGWITEIWAYQHSTRAITPEEHQVGITPTAITFNLDMDDMAISIAQWPITSVSHSTKKKGPGLIPFCRGITKGKWLRDIILDVDTPTLALYSTLRQSHWIPTFFNTVQCYDSLLLFKYVIVFPFNIKFSESSKRWQTAYCLVLQQILIVN